MNELTLGWLRVRLFDLLVYTCVLLRLRECVCFCVGVYVLSSCAVDQDKWNPLQCFGEDALFTFCVSHSISRSIFAFPPVAVDITFPLLPPNPSSSVRDEPFTNTETLFLVSR